MSVVLREVFTDGFGRGPTVDISLVSSHPFSDGLHCLAHIMFATMSALYCIDEIVGFTVYIYAGAVLAFVKSVP